MKEYEYTLSASLSGELLLFHTLWNNSDDHMFIVSIDSEGDFINDACNRSLENTLNVKEHQLDGLKIKDILDDTTYKNLSDKYNKCIVLNKPITYDESAVLDNEEERHFNTTILPVLDQDTGSVRIFGISREFTQLKNIQNELQKVNETLEVQVQERTKELTVALERMEKLSATDKLTGIFNRLKLDSVLEENIKLSKRYNTPLGLIIIDIDFFKRVNDAYGHQIGDIVLAEFANILKISVRETDVVGRWGGEEFLIICQKTDLEGTSTLADHIRQKIEKYKFTEVEQITASFGVTAFKENDTLKSIVKRSDNALYEAKGNGRNSVVHQF